MHNSPIIDLPKANQCTTEAVAPQACVVVSKLPSADATPAPGTFPLAVNSVDSVHSVQKTGWESVREYAGLAAKFQHCSLAAQVMAGFELLALRKAHNVRPGAKAGENHWKNAVHNSATSAELTSNPSDPSGKSNPSDTPKPWAAIVKENTGIAERTARNWMAMAAQCAPRLRKLNGNERLKALVNIPPNHWTEEDSALMFDATRKLTDGKTQLDFLAELGLCKKPHGATGGARERNQDDPLTAEEEIALAKQMAQEEIEACFLKLTAIAERFTLLDDFHIEAQSARFELEIKARRMWLALSKPQRTPAQLDLIRQMLQLKTS
jgi:hypothetical protein